MRPGYLTGRPACKLLSAEALNLPLCLTSRNCLKVPSSFLSNPITSLPRVGPRPANETPIKEGGGRSLIKQPTVTTVSPVVTTRKKREKKRNKKNKKKKKKQENRGGRGNRVTFISFYESFRFRRPRSRMKSERHRKLLF